VSADEKERLSKRFDFFRQQPIVFGEAFHGQDKKRVVFLQFDFLAVRFKIWVVWCTCNNYDIIYVSTFGRL
jgi:hypothetical protein